MKTFILHRKDGSKQVLRTTKHFSEKVVDIQKGKKVLVNTIDTICSDLKASLTPSEENTDEVPKRDVKALKLAKNQFKQQIPTNQPVLKFQTLSGVSFERLVA